MAGLLSAPPTSGDADRRTLEEEGKVSGDSRTANFAESLEGMLQHIIWAGSTVSQAAPDMPRKPVRLNMFEVFKAKSSTILESGRSAY